MFIIKNQLINRDMDYEAIDVDVQAMFDPPELNENEC